MATNSRKLVDAARKLKAATVDLKLAAEVTREVQGRRPRTETAVDADVYLLYEEATDVLMRVSALAAERGVLGFESPQAS